jgi:hypothetical protein
MANEQIIREIKPDCTLTPLVHQYNNLDSKVQVVIGGYPILAIRDFIVRSNDFDTIYEKFQIMMSKYEKKDLNFDPQYLFIDH